MGTICRKTESVKNNMGQTGSETHRAILIITVKHTAKSIEIVTQGK